MKTPFGYIRVSGLGQADKDGPRRQKQVIRDFCSRNNLPEPKFYEDLGVSGTKESLDRPAFQNMLADAALEGTDTIIVENMDRLARDLIVSEVLLHELGKNDFKLYSTEIGFTDLVAVTDDPGRKAIRQIFGVMAEYAKSMLIIKLACARARKKSVDGRCEGDKPYGRDKKEQTVLTLIKQLRDAGASFNSIAENFNAAGVKKRKGKAAWGKADVYHLWKVHIDGKEDEDCLHIS
jgi:DNA invertase Pin-like site-specific DNA recombinase